MKTILLLGATGTIGRAVAARLLALGHKVVCPVRAPDENLAAIGADIRCVNISAGSAEQAKLFGTDIYDALISCMASRSGVPEDAWAIDYQLHSDMLGLARDQGVPQFVLLSALCVQKPTLAFQKAKLAFEAELVTSGLTYSIIRPTAFFKSLSGQVARVQRGKPFMVFGDGHLTRTKPISDQDLADYIVRSLDDESMANKILPIGGPGPAMSPREQGAMLFALLGQAPRFHHFPAAFLAILARLVSVVSWLVPPLKKQAELLKIGHYYASQSMLVFDPETGTYREDMTPSFGADTLEDHFRQLIAGNKTHHVDEHTLFDRVPDGKP